MAACKRPDIAERLLMALSPSDFAREVAELEDHLKECASCQEEMNELRRVEDFLGGNKDLVQECLSPCPQVDALSSFALGDSADPSVARHLELCAYCREQVALVTQLSHESLQSEKRSASAREKAFFHQEVARQYGLTEAPSVEAARNLWETIRSWFHVPSLALGAAVAALLVVFLMPREPEELRLTPVLSNVVWKKTPAATKEFLGPKEMLPARKKVALVLLLSGSGPPGARDIADMYNKLEIVEKLGAAYDFLSPKDIKDVLAGREIARNLMGIAGAVFEKTDADYLLTFEVLPTEAEGAVKGTIFQRGQKTGLGSIAQTGVALSRMPSRITTIGLELLLDADQS